MSEHRVDEDAPAPAPARGDRWRTIARGFGQTLITLGVVMMLFVVYEVYITNITADHKQTVVREALKKEWAAGKDPLKLPNGQVATIPAGAGIANLYLPRLGRDYAETVVQGTNDSDLMRGPGHYTGTALPGQVGNFAVAGHRVGKGEPFLNLDHLKPGDAVIVETYTDWYVYRVLGDVQTGDMSVKTDGVPGSEIVLPSDGNVIAPVPDQPGATPTKAMMTMTTCHPKFTATHRLVLHAVLDASLTTPRTSETMPASIAALYSQVSR